MTEDSIIDALYFRFGNGWLSAVPRYTLREWWEADLFALTKAGFSVEYEIKLSRSDFAADAKKARSRYRAFGTEDRHQGWRREHRNKHEELASRGKGCPSRFFFVTPQGLLDGLALPDWAGHIEVEPRAVRPLETETKPLRPWNFRIVAKKKAPKLHTDRAPTGLCADMNRTLYYRFWRNRLG